MLQPSKKLYQKLQKQYSRRINLDLKRIKKVLEKLNNPEEQLQNVINIIGSDGKNSVLTSLKYFLEANKEKVNTFTSPHLYDVRLRFWLGNRFISINEIKKYKQLIEKTKVKEFIGNDILWTLQRMEFESFLKNGSVPAYSGLTLPTYKVSLWNNNSEKFVELRVGNSDLNGQKYFAQIEGQTGYYKIKKKYLDSIPLVIDGFKS